MNSVISAFSVPPKHSHYVMSHIILRFGSHYAYLDTGSKTLDVISAAESCSW